MADRRRRRISEAESEEDTRHDRIHDDNDVEVADDHSTHTDVKVKVHKNAEEDEEESEEEETDEEEESEEEDDESYDEEDESVIIEGDDGLDEERQSGDGEEQPEGNEAVDDDEDKKNPAYVPKQGAFYEHDMRISMDEQEEDEKKPKKKLWKDEGKWQHDKYNESMQGPKTRAELYSVYGYDITRSDKAPEAPPRSNQPRGPRSKQKSRFRDFIHEGDYVQNRNSYNNLKSGGRQGYDENGRGGWGFSRRGGDNYRRNDRYRNDNSYYNNRNRGYNKSSQGDFNSREDFPELGYKEKPRRSDEGRGFQNDRRSDQEYHNRGFQSEKRNEQEYHRRSEQEYHSRGERSSQDRDNKGPRDNRSSSERENRSHYNRDNNEQIHPEKSDYESRSSKDNRSSVERTSYPREERISPEQEGKSYNDSYRRGRGSRGGRGNRRPGGRKPEPERNFPERNFPPRFQRMKQNMAAAEGDPSLQQGTGGDEEVYMSPPESPPEGKQGFPPPPQRESQPQVAPVAESLIVQNTGERKSYSKERRVKSGRGPEEPPPPVVPEETAPAEPQGKQEEVIQSQQFDNKAYSKQDQGGKPKRYSSQRQRNIPEVGGFTEQPIDSQKFYPPASQANFPAHPNPAILRPPIATVAFPMNAVPSAAMSTPQHIFPGNQPAAMTTQVQMIPPQYTNTGVLYPAAPNFPVPPVPLAGFAPMGNHPPALATHQQGYPSPPGTQPTSVGAQQSPTQAGPQEMFRNQTVYYPPELQMRGSRATPKRAKAAIPIVNPKEVKREFHREGYLEEENVSQEDHVEQVPHMGLVSSEEQVPFEDPTNSRDSKEFDGLEDLQGHNEAPSGDTDIVKTEENLIDNNINNSNNTVLSEVSESVLNTDREIDDSESSVVVKSEPECSVDQDSVEHAGEIRPEASVKTEDIGDTVRKEESEDSQTLQIKTEPVDEEYETKKDFVESSAEMVHVKEEEENVSDNESFADAKDELENETDKQEDGDPVT
ncbi:protein CASC3-like isoform X2 [Saccostrea echinata]|uniref:protein CASC3-like isoform X2 n=1 Tax=Saccostrea echinata TaxID=191078 RepID=UPI002A8402BE|nr:protein CASC3-like isoform X2 [Saccostrea echinata]